MPRPSSERDGIMRGATAGIRSRRGNTSGRGGLNQPADCCHPLTALERADLVFFAKSAQIRRLPPLTLPLRGSLPLPARGERTGVRGIAGVTGRLLRLFLELMRAGTTDFVRPGSCGPSPAKTKFRRSDLFRRVAARTGSASGPTLPAET